MGKSVSKRKCKKCGEEFITFIAPGPTPKFCKNIICKKKRSKIHSKNYYLDPSNRKKLLDKQSEYRKTPRHKELYKIKVEKYKKDGTNKKHRRKRYLKDKADPKKFTMLKILNNVRKRIRTSVRTHDIKYSNKKTIKLIGCTSYELKKHLENQFKDGMKWENYGLYWEVDHILPLSKFNLLTEKGRCEANHYTNLQPLKSDINRKKGNKILKNYTE